MHSHRDRYSPPARRRIVGWAVALLFGLVLWVACLGYPLAVLAGWLPIPSK